MATKARELARHFETQGTPVMIGKLQRPLISLCSFLQPAYMLLCRDVWMGQGNLVGCPTKFEF